MPLSVKTTLSTRFCLWSPVINLVIFFPLSLLTVRCGRGARRTPLCCQLFFHIVSDCLGFFVAGNTVLGGRPGFIARRGGPWRDARRREQAREELGNGSVFCPENQSRRWTISSVFRLATCEEMRRHTSLPREESNTTLPICQGFTVQRKLVGQVTKAAAVVLAVFSSLSSVLKLQQVH